jgi:hypothetical protein
VLDGDFEDRTDTGRLGWQVSSDEDEGVRADIRRCENCEDGGYALRIRFDGEHNSNFYRARQYVPVIGGGAYRLSARVSADQITSAEGPLLMVGGATGVEGEQTDSCRFHVKSDPLRGTVPWHDVVLDFVVPRSCEGVWIGLVRLRTDRLNRLISGEAWLDDVRLQLIAGPVEQPGEEAVSPSALLPRAAGSLSIDLVKRRVDAATREDPRGALRDESSRALTDELDGTLQGGTQPRRPLVDGVGVSGHGMEEPAAEPPLGATLGVLAPNPEERIAVELQQSAGVDPGSREVRPVLEQFVALGVGNDGRQAAGAQREDRLLDSRGNDRDGHLEKDGGTAAEKR